MIPVSPLKWERVDWTICLILLFVTLGLYSNVRHFEFVDYDDRDYATAPQLREGLTLDAVEWALTSGDAANWFPVTRLSHLLDYQLFAPASGPAHLTSVVIHILDAFMLFLFLRRATGARWKSAFVAFLFAWHPLHVESVAWVSERKDVLCAFFWFLSLWLWVRYVERPGWQRYLSVLLVFSLGLMSKPMIVTLPVLLLLINCWPLRRPFSRRLLLEVVPFFALSALGSVIAFAVQNGGGAVTGLSVLTLRLRFENALLAFAIYIADMFWPANLGFWYPYHAGTPLWLVAICAILILAASAMALRALHSWLAVGWLWFVITLLPVIGLIQVGSQSHADRYTYVPMVGLLIILLWGMEAIVTRWPGARLGMIALGVLACIVLLPVSWLQIQTWQNSEALFRRGIEINNGDCPPAWYNLGTLALKAGRPDEAVTDLKDALTLSPNDAAARANLGAAFSQKSDWAEAIPQFEKAVALDPESATYLHNLGVALLQAGRFAEAVRTFEAALTLAPTDEGAKQLLQMARAKSGVH